MPSPLARFDAHFTPERHARYTDAGLLFLRLGVGLMMAFSHGLGKLQNLLGDAPIQFADPIGIGVGPSLALAASAEFFCSLLLAIGLMTRLVTVPLLITMAVAVFLVHADDPFGKKEFGLLYMVPYLTLLLTGPGRLSVDGWLKARRAR